MGLVSPTTIVFLSSSRTLQRTRQRVSERVKETAHFARVGARETGPEVAGRGADCQL